MTNAAQKLLNMLSTSADRRRDAYEQAEYHVPDVEHNFADKSDFEKNFFGIPTTPTTNGRKWETKGSPYKSSPREAHKEPNGYSKYGSRGSRPIGNRRDGFRGASSSSRSRKRVFETPKERRKPQNNEGISFGY